MPNVMDNSSILKRDVENGIRVYVEKGVKSHSINVTYSDKP